VSSKFLRMHYTSGRLMTHKQTELALTSLERGSQKEAPKLAVEGNRFWSRSIIATILLPFFGD